MIIGDTRGRYPATSDTPEWAERARNARVILGGGTTPEIEATLEGEDFGRFLWEFPGAYLRLGPGAPDDKQHHRVTVKVRWVASLQRVQWFSA